MAEWLFQAKSSRPPRLPTTASPSPQSSMNQNNRASKRTKLMDRYFQPSSSYTPPAPPSGTPAIPPISTLAQASTAYHDPSSQPTPYSPDAICSSLTPHPHVTIESVKTAHIPALMRTTGLLLPVRYPNSFYTATIIDPVIASVSRVAIYREPSAKSSMKTAPYTHSTSESSAPTPETVIGGIRCRLEPIPPSTSRDSNSGPKHNLYIQTLHLLSPYRGNGIATSLLDSILYAGPSNESPSKSTSSPRPVSPIVKHYNIQTVTAHVHETNEDALSWYRSRGFTIQDEVVEGYYRRLKPGGARIVILDLSTDAAQRNSQTAPTERNDHATGTDGRFDASEDADDEDGDWEKVDAKECECVEQLQDYQAIDPKVDLDRAQKKTKSRS